jgi:YHS domain-containing protein
MGNSLLTGRRWRAGALALSLVAGPGGADERTLPPVVGAAEVFAIEPFSGLALRGFDPVSYFEHGAPVPGRAEFDTIWAGAAWRFASEANREAFRRNPAAFAPRLGGYDPVAMADERVVPADPSVFTVEDGRLYLFRDVATRDRVLADPSMLQRAEARWPRLRRGLVQP